ncbi:MAG: teichuronic acid biosynthesis glycosyltransferase TuaC [Methyloprofundus sp.]|nr:MAG: teichuronic acid biosynthesis glycosyltransferase TuaC [Methyloprofundus sp.]
MNQPKLLVYCTLFPSNKRPNAGVFIRERMFRVGQQLPIVVVSPVPWFPLQGIIRYWKPNFRPQPDKFEIQQGVQVYFPRFLSIPGLFKSWDGFLMALGSFTTLVKLKKEFNIIDAHFAYPDGYAATILGKWFKVPVTMTLRGTEVPLSKIQGRKIRMLKAINCATRIFSVADSLKQHVVSLGASSDKIRVVGNGVDINKFYALDKRQERAELNISVNAKVLVSVGALVERKGFHRVIEALPELIKKYPDLIYLIIGGDSPEGNIRNQLEQQVKTLELEKHVQFLGALSSEQLKKPLSTADIFALSTANEGWANVFLEAMACGLPVVTTDVGGNREVVNNDDLGIIVPFDDKQALVNALFQSLEQTWDKENIIAYARNNAWDTRVEILVGEFKKLVA